MENSYLNLPIDDEDSLLQLQGASVSYRIAMGPQQGQKVFTLQTLPASNKVEYGQLANISGFSLHAGTSCRGVLLMPSSQRNWKGYAGTSVDQPLVSSV